MALPAVAQKTFAEYWWLLVADHEVTKVECMNAAWQKRGEIEKRSILTHKEFLT